jgi:hypothetical protein
MLKQMADVPERRGLVKFAFELTAKGCNWPSMNKD